MLSKEEKDISSKQKEIETNSKEVLASTPTKAKENDIESDQSQYSQIEDQQLLLSNFLLQNKIGMGSFGKVFKVKEKKTDKIFAVKISIHSINEITNDAIKDLITEVNIISKLHHPCILKYIGYSPIDFKNKPKPVIITEFASNGSLQDLIDMERSSKSKWNSTQKLIIIYGIASAMAYLHENDIIHRDLKPGNILIDSFLFPKIADFGLSKIKQNDKLNQSSVAKIKGTPIYIAPEIWKKYEYSKAGDVYAFGMIVYEIITNEKPFSEVNIFQILSMVASGYRPKFVNPIPPAYCQLIESCWSEDPKNRPTFSLITEKLKNDKRFITELIDEKEFLKYVKYIEESKVSFDSTKNNIKKDDLCTLFKQFNNVKEYENENIKIIQEYENKVKICPFNYFLELNNNCKKLIEEAENNLSNMFDISKRLIEGQEPFEQNIEIGIEYLNHAANNGSIEANVYYFKLLIKGDIIPPNIKKAYKILETVIKEEKSTYFYLKGMMLIKENKYEEAIESYKKSIDLNNQESFYEYGKILLKGKGTPINKEKGIEYLKESAERGSIHGMYKYGKLLIKGEDIPKDEYKGQEYIKKAADLGDAKSLYYY